MKYFWAWQNFLQVDLVNRQFLNTAIIVFLILNFRLTCPTGVNGFPHILTKHFVIKNCTVDTKANGAKTRRYINRA